MHYRPLPSWLSDPMPSEPNMDEVKLTTGMKATFAILALIVIGLSAMINL